jgi:hypothetical protein
VNDKLKNLNNTDVGRPSNNPEIDAVDSQFALTSPEKNTNERETNHPIHQEGMLFCIYHNKRETNHAIHQGGMLFFIYHNKRETNHAIHQRGMLFCMYHK